LDEWASYLVKQLAAGADAYVFCHSPDNLAAPWICKELHRRVGEQIKITPLPWDESGENQFEQGKLL
jgi:uncharacterized protein YecE (DUF72 family)